MKATLCLAALLAACAPVQKPRPARVPAPSLTRDRALDGAIFKQALSEALHAATRVEIVEHSSPWDLRKDERRPGEKVYGSVRLEPAALEAFRGAVGRLDAGTKTIFMACVPAYHHRINLYEGAELASVLDVCFQCGILEWTGAGYVEPQALWPLLATTVTQAGLQPHRDWKALAR